MTAIVESNHFIAKQILMNAETKLKIVNKALIQFVIGQIKSWISWIFKSCYSIIKFWS